MNGQGWHLPYHLLYIASMFQKVYHLNLRKQQSCQENNVSNVNNSDVEDNSSLSQNGIKIGNENNECNAFENKNGNVRIILCWKQMTSEVDESLILVRFALF